jgi:RNA ligase (TIGR02306 family)
MANWKVSKEIVEVLPHLNSDNLEIVRAGEYQLVSRKETYQNGDTIIVVPYGSVLTNGAMIQEFGKYLSGSKKDRVKSTVMRGELSQGITWPTDKETLVNTFGDRIADLVEAAHMGEDISDLLGITKYEAPVPASLRGQAAGIRLVGKKYDINHDIYRHDAYPWGAFSSQFDPNENVMVTEKVHGSLVSYTAVFEDGELTEEVVTSKGQLKKGLQWKDDGEIAYWKAVKNSNFRGLAHQLLSERLQTDNAIITFTAEVVPAQKGFSYGFSVENPMALIFDVEVDGTHVSINQVTGEIREMWVPVLYQGPLKDVDLYKFVKGKPKEQVSGKELHISEGCVVTPETPRNSTKGGFNLHLKLISEAYSKQETGEEVT